MKRPIKKRPVRKAAQESKRKVTNLLAKGAKVVDSDSESYDGALLNGVEADEDTVAKVSMSSRGKRRKERTTSGSEPSNATKKVFLKQTEMFGSDTEDSDYDPVVQPDEDDASCSSADEDPNASSNEEDFQEPKRAKSYREIDLNKKPRTKKGKKKDKNLPKSVSISSRGKRREEKTTGGSEPSNATKKVFLNQMDMFGSDTEDSEYNPVEQLDEDDAGHSSTDENPNDLGNGEDCQVPKRAKPSEEIDLNKKPRTKKGKKKDKNVQKSGHNVLDKLDWKVWEKEYQDWAPCGSDGEIDLDALAQRKGNAPVDVREPPSNLLMPLLPFQKEWLAWSLKQEESEYKGGILADEMGMGKTIQAISLILSSCSHRSGNSHTENRPTPFPSAMDASHNKSKVLPQIKATLVVCPLVAVIQWRNEIARFTSEGSTKVLIYHGANRCKDPAELAKYDIVLTTYSIVEVEHRKTMMPGKERCRWCGKLFHPDRLSVHQHYYCGPTAVRTEKQAKQVKRKQTNVTSGKSSKKNLTNEEEDIEIDDSKRNIKGKQISKGSRKKQKLQNSVDGKHMDEGILSDEDLETYKKDTKKNNADVYNSAGGLNNGSASSAGSSILHTVKWDRIILDEAHFIKDRRCSTSKAVFSLESSYKWALSGTPLQNRVGELYSLVRFLQIFPYSYYFCKKCDCKSLDYSFGKDWQKCDDCGHSPVQHFCWWNKFIANPIKRYGYVGDGQKALILLKYKILNSIVLRRTKIERAADLALPPRVAFLRRDTFDAREEDFYQALYTQSQAQFNTYIAAGTLVNNYAHIFDLLTRLRQAVDHPYLVVYSKTAAQCPNNQNNAYDSVKDVCGICHDEPDDPMSASCGHTFCKTCIQEYISSSGLSSCPTCQKPLTIDLTGRKNTSNNDCGNKVKGYKRSSILNRINLDNFQTSTKIDALREEIELMQQKDGGAKAIVFSQFTSFLDLINFSLQKSGIKCLQLVGSMSIQARDQTIEKFTNDPHYKVFLMSLKAGGVALNLTVASHVFLMDPWWNPAVEQQAQDRIHRLGQYKPMRVVRFVIANTIEERILRLQEKKQLVFEGTVGGSTEALGRLTEEDLRFLFTN